MVSSSIFMLLVYISFFKIFQVQGTDCTITWKPTLRDFHPPLILVKNKLSNEYDIILPVGKVNKEIRVPEDRKLTLSCPGDQNGNKLIKFPNSEKGGVSGIEAECNTGGVLEINGIVQRVPYTMNDWSCEKNIVASIEKYDARKGYAKCYKWHNGKSQPIGDLIKIGFYSYGGYYYSQIEVCFNNKLKTTAWTRHTLHGLNLAAHSTDRETHWTSDALYGNTRRPAVKWSDIYIGQYQKTLLKVKLNRDLVFPSGSRLPASLRGLFMAKGHLSPNADFVTSAERGATFHYINALPQWQANNNGNWKNIVEVSVQKLAGQKMTDLIIISGGHGILMLESQKTSTSTMEEIFLIDSPTTKVVPVPELFWKVVYDPSTDEAVSFVVTNNPYMTANPDIMCKDKNNNPHDVCNQLDPTWFKGKKPAIHDKPKGYTYCCKVEELMKNIPNIPTGYTGRNLLGRTHKRPRPPGT